MTIYEGLKAAKGECESCIARAAIAQATGEKD